MDKNKLYKEYIKKSGETSFLLNLISVLERLKQETAKKVRNAPTTYNGDMKKAVAKAQTYIEAMIETMDSTEKSNIWSYKHDLLNDFEAYLKPLPKGFK